MKQATVITNETVENCIDRANRLRQEGKLDEAIALYHRAIELDPNSYQSYHYIGETLAQKNELDAAANFYNLALEINPEFFWSYHCLGLVLFWQGKYDEAIAAARRAIDIEPKRAVFHYQLGLYLERKLELDSAIAAYSNALELEPNLTEACHHLEMIWQQQSQSKLDISESHPEDSEQARDIGTDRSNLGTEYLRTKGAELASQGDRQGAIKAYTQAIDLEPLQPTWVYCELINHLKAENKLELAINVGITGLEHYPNNTEILRTYGAALASQGNLQEAIAAYTKSIEIEPLQPIWVYCGLINHLKAEKQIESAINIGATGLKQYPDNTEILRTYGAVLIDRGDREKAIEAYVKAIELDANQPVWVYCALLDLLKDEKEFDQAIAFGRKGLVEHPDNIEILRTLGAVLARKGDSQSAIAIYSKVVELNPEQPAWVYCALSELIDKPKQQQSKVKTSKLHKIIKLDRQAEKLQKQPINKNITNIDGLDYTARLYAAAKRIDRNDVNLQENEEYLAFINSKGMSTPTITSLFDYEFYLEQLPSLLREKINPVIHYCSQGYRLGLKPHVTFDTDFLISQIDEEEIKNIPPLLYYLEHGRNSDISPNTLFEPKVYLANVGEEFIGHQTPFETFLERWADCKVQFSSYFDWRFYEHQVSLVKELSLNPLVHYFSEPIERRADCNPLFHGLYYFHTYEEVKKSELDPLVYFLQQGIKEGHMPNPFVREELFSGQDLQTHLMIEAMYKYLEYV